MGATIKDIQAKTGLGLATISKYLNGGHVLEENQDAIEKAIAELDFQVNGFARSLKTRQSNTVGVVIPHLNNLFMTNIISYMEEKLREQGYGVLVSDTGGKAEREQEVVSFLQRRMVDGMIIMPSGRESPALQDQIRRRIPTVLIDRQVDSVDGMLDMVLVDNFKAAYETTSYLIERGHRKIGILIGEHGIYTSDKRLEGYRKALTDAGIAVDDHLIRTTGFTMDGAYRETVELLENKHASAIFATNFEMTFGSLIAARDKGYDVPKDVSLVGFDNRELARAMQPSLTIVQQPLEDIAKKAAELLLSRMQTKNDKHFTPQKILLDARLEEGASVRSI